MISWGSKKKRHLNKPKPPRMDQPPRLLHFLLGKEDLHWDGSLCATWEWSFRLDWLENIGAEWWWPRSQTWWILLIFDANCKKHKWLSGRAEDSKQSSKFNHWFVVMTSEYLLSWVQTSSHSLSRSASWLFTRPNTISRVYPATDVRKSHHSCKENIEPIW